MNEIGSEPESTARPRGGHSAPTVPRIAVVGMACRYPDADSPDRLWENVLAGRRAFRRLPDERMRAEDYYSPDPTAPDRFYSLKAAVIDGWEFDRVGYRIAGSTYRSTDLVHWLALDTAAQALADAGFPSGRGLPTERTGVVIGNTLTGEFSRANLMRLRWPYVRRTVGAALRDEGWEDSRLTFFLDQLETRYKQPFPPIDEDTLAGGLANTISGRICNHFDLKGGGYTVDGACSSSLLSVATGCNALSSGELDAAVVGGVDLSIDPFEVIGFAKTGALATGEMRVYDRDSNGFWPGEGCGVLVLMRDEDAVRLGCRRYATIAGWGYSSDGKGSITRPEATGHRLALRRCYAAAGFGIDTVAYLEGHGTGTAVGDATELRAFTQARLEADPAAPPAAISTIKGNIGHTKAAAGVAGLLKAILAVRFQVIPPATGHVQPHPELTGDRPALRVPRTAELWPPGAPVRAGVSSMGFGGINAHLVVEHADGVRRVGVGRTTTRLVRSRQDKELLLVDAASVAELRGRIARLVALVARLSYAELGDLAGTLQDELAGGPIRAAVVAGAPEQAERRFDKLLTMLDNGARSVLDVEDGVFLGSVGGGEPRIGFLFPGQGAGQRGDGGAIRHRFECVDDLYRTHRLPTDGDLVATAVAQPRIVTSSIAGLRVLAELGIEGVVAAGHSLGELTALHWAGAMDEATVVAVATARGRIMAEASEGGGTMAGIAAAPDRVRPLLAGERVVIAGYNSPRQTVVSGPVAAVERVCAEASARNLATMRINVSHAFHSELVAPAATELRTYLRARPFRLLTRPMVSTVSGAALAPDTDVPELLARQVLDPVRFTEAVTAVAGQVDLLFEVGPGHVLSGLARESAPAVPVISLATDDLSLAGLLHAVAAAWTLGAPVRTEALHRDRFTRPLPLDKEFRFFANPAESAPADAISVLPAPVESAATPAPAQASGATAIDLLRRFAAERAELPLSAVRPDSHLLDELHLSSITVGQIVNQASGELGLSPPAVTSAYATATLAELAGMLDQLRDTGTGHDGDRAEAAKGVAPWVRAFAVDLVPSGLSAPAAPREDGRWQVFASDGHPLAADLQIALDAARLGDGVLLCLPNELDERHTGLMLVAARSVLSGATTVRFVVVGGRKGAAGLAKTLHLESPETRTTVVTLPPEASESPDRAADTITAVVTDVAATDGFREVHYDTDGTRRLPVLRPVDLRPRLDHEPLGAGDVLLVTGGGKGITAECALALGRGSGASVGLLGRSDPATDPELAANLERMAAAGVRHRYVRTDVTVPEEVRAAVAELRGTLGPVTAVLHGAGRNEPRPIMALDEESFRRTLAPKVSGLEAVLAATDPASLKLLITFGSIIGRAGLRGEADYATANDWLTDLTRRVADRHPDCRCVAIEWSVWSGAGMGERLGVLEALIRDGISPIPAEDGIGILRQILADPSTPTAMVVMGRADGLPTVAFDRPDLPLLRFVDRIQVHYPGVELVVDTDLSAGGDLYLTDHLLDGDLLFPAALGMEAMAQAAAALTGRWDSPVLENMEFLRPIVVPPDGTATIRIAALVTGPGVVTAVIRAADTGFQADHFRATLRFGVDRPADAPVPTGPAELLAVSPASELYGQVLFQGKRFQRLIGYRQLSATHCVAEISNTPTDRWFAAYLSDDLVLADPGTRDCAMHAIQCDVPDATLLPTAVRRLYLADRVSAPERPTVVLYAAERFRDGDTYVYDVDVRDPAGALVERWSGLELRAVRKQDGSGPWLPALLGPYLERRAESVTTVPLRCVVRPDGVEPGSGVALRRHRTASAVSWATDGTAAVRYRPDGRPELDSGATMSASHGSGVTFVILSPAGRRVGCDVEPVVDRSARDWANLLGADQVALARLLAEERGEPLPVAATRVWGAMECLRKTGWAGAEPVTGATGVLSDRWALLRSGSARIATFVTRLKDVAGPVVFTMLTEEDD